MLPKPTTPSLDSFCFLSRAGPVLWLQRSIWTAFEENQTRKHQAPTCRLRYTPWPLAPHTPAFLTYRGFPQYLQRFAPVIHTHLLKQSSCNVALGRHAISAPGELGHDTTRSRTPIRRQITIRVEKANPGAAAVHAHHQ